MKITFGIPSYKRSEKQKTLEYLCSMGYTKNDIIISTQTEDDYNLYQAYADRATIIHKEGHCVGDNRNTLLEYCSNNNIRRLIMLDDDIVALNILSKDSKENIPINDRDKFQDLLEWCFRLADNNKCFLWGCYPAENVMFKKHSVDDKNILTGCILGISFFKWRFDPKYTIKEDIEASLRMIAKGYNCLRFNMLSVKAAHKTKGGCEEWWKTDSNRQCAIMLKSQYPDLVEVQKNKPQEVRTIFKKSKIWHTMTAPDGQQR